MFKRKGRVLFLDPGAGTRARMAQAWARELGGGWVEPAAAALETGVPDPDLVPVMAEAGVSAEAAPCPAWEAVRGQDWDLVVPLDSGGGQDWAALLQGARSKRWELGGLCPPGHEAAGTEALRTCRQALKERVDGLLGGFRMKAREDDSAARMPNDGEAE